MKTILKYEVTYVVNHEAPLDKFTIHLLRSLPLRVTGNTYTAQQTKVALKSGEKVKS